MNQPVAVPEVLSADLPAGVFLLDVREDDEWTAGHAPDAVHVRLGELGARVDELPQGPRGVRDLPHRQPGRPTRPRRWSGAG